MKFKLLAVALSVVAVPAYAAMGTTEIPTFAGQAAAREAAKHATPQTPEEWLARMTDFTRNLSAFKDPKVFIPWSNAVTEPSFYIAMMNGMMDPGGWLNMMNSMAHPDAVRNLVQFADPNIYLKWSAASLDPNFYTALLTQLTDPGKLMRWAMVPVDPKLWNMMLNTLNPNTYIRWGMSPMDPRAWNLAGTVANPALYTGMLGAVINPNGYGQGTANWLTWTPAPPVQGAGSFAMWDPIAMLGNLSGYIPGLQGFSLPQLPQIGLPNFSLPTLPTLPSLTPAPAAMPSAKPAETAPAPAAAPKADTKSKSEAKPAEAVKADAAKTDAAKTDVAKADVAKTGAAKAEAKPEAAKSGAKQTAAAPVVAVPVPVVTVPVIAAPTVAAPAANKVILAADTLFKLNKSGIRDLSKEGKARLDDVLAKLKGMGEIEQIKVVGHADPTGNAASNQKLSEARAKSIKSYLVAKGVKPNVIMSSGLGDTQPVVECESGLAKEKLRECHAPNRRVVIEIIAKAK